MKVTGALRTTQNQHPRGFSSQNHFFRGKGVAIPGQPSGNGAVSQCDVLAMACRKNFSLPQLRVPALGEVTWSRGSPLPPFPGQGSPGHAGSRCVWLLFPGADLPVLSPLCLTPAPAAPLCQQEGGKLQCRKHLVSPTGLPPCSPHLTASLLQARTKPCCHSKIEPSIFPVRRGHPHPGQSQPPQAAGIM